MAVNMSKKSDELTATVRPPLNKNLRTRTERIEKFISNVYFTDCNLFGQLYSDRIPFQSILHVDFQQKRVSFCEALDAFTSGKGNAVSNGFSFGPTWSTHWFKIVQNRLDPRWLSKRVHIRWDAGCEAMIWDKSGRPLQGLSGDFDRTDYILSEEMQESDLHQQEFFIECAANNIFGAGASGQISPPKLDLTFTLKTAEFAVLDTDAYRVFMDLEVLLGIAQKLPETSHRKAQALFTANQIVNLLAHDRSPTQLERGHRMASDFFAQKNGESQFTLYATANCHIDTAWLWPYAETRRKVGRSWATALRILEHYPEMVFAVSQAVQIEWLRQDYPMLYTEICEKAKTGGFVGVGGAWVEMDGLLPNGESFVRQLLYGQKEFLRTFGKYCDIFWLPDTFGYSGQLPQIMCQAGMTRFLTQKISWNLVNKFPHHTFHWAGIDGTSVLTHFPPTDTYCASMTVEEVLKTSENFADKGRSDVAMMLYGYGDGGGGPDTKMLERMRRMTDVDGLPKVKSASPSEFFDHVEKERDGLCKWSGELYLELHNGTYTTQAATKKNNRQCEFLLRDAEFFVTFKGAVSKENIPSLESIWKKVLLNQFHDVIPGSSIADVYRDADSLYEEVRESCKEILGVKKETGDLYLANSLSWERIVPYDGVIYNLPPMSVSRKKDVIYKSEDSLWIEKIPESGEIKMGNRHLIAVVNRNGRVTSLRINTEGIQDSESALWDAVAPGCLCNDLCLYDDVPLYWDAWDVMDYHLETRLPQNNLMKPLEIVNFEGTDFKGIAVVAEFQVKIGKSSLLTQKIILRKEQPFLEFHSIVEWNENHKMLKVEFPLNVHAERATYEIQFGHLTRPTHKNTSWDSAKFEVCGHKWADLSESGFGVALLNDSKYGYSCSGKTLVLSLLRSPKSPDDKADMGRHEFTYAFMPHLGSFQAPTNCGKSVIQAAYELNTPPRVAMCDKRLPGGSMFSVDNPAVIIESVKGAENGGGIVLRLYEAYGGKAVTLVTVAEWLAVEGVRRVGLLERNMEDTEKSVEIRNKNVIRAFLKPFEIVSVLITV